MCLDYVVKDQFNTQGIGWKWFDLEEGRPALPFYQNQFGGCTDYFMPTNCWVRAKSSRITVDHPNTGPGIGRLEYDAGFHLYLEYPSIWRGMSAFITPVLYRKGQTIGSEISRLVLVADEMYIPEPNMSLPTLRKAMKRLLELPL